MAFQSNAFQADAFQMDTTGIAAAVVVQRIRAGSRVDFAAARSGSRVDPQRLTAGARVELEVD